MGCSVQHGTGFSFHLAYLPMCRVQFPEAHEKKKKQTSPNGNDENERIGKKGNYQDSRLNP